MTTTPRAALGEILAATSGDPLRRVLLTGGAVVSMDRSIGDLQRGDVLIEGSRIIDVGPDLRSLGAADSAIVIDTAGAIVSPGFVDSHRHAWETQLRRIMPDVNDLGEYVMSTLNDIAPLYQPADMYAGTKLAALTALDSGITCMLDFSHNSRTAEHSDAAIQALADTRIRGVHASMGPHFGNWNHQWPSDLKRIKERYFNSPDQLLTLRLAALATDEIAGPEIAYGQSLANTARELDLWVSVDAVFGQASSRAILDWKTSGILNDRMTLIHCTGLTDEAWDAMGAAGTTVSLAPSSDAQIGLESAIPAVNEALGAGIRPALSIDVEVALASDMFTQMRTLLSVQRMLAVNAAYGTTAEPHRITARDVLDFATVQGARSNGLGDVTGSLTPGKQADLLIIAAEDVNNLPLNDAVGTIVLGADPRNIEAVFVAGEALKWNRELVGVNMPSLRTEILESRDRILQAN
ncbi:amidohydrolase family protein [Arthrobacter sp. M2012083]|uniref:amidohydrolase family protein n=1 Tax=Arthrobacter sp. M2012083 TaxID=1197706 RepID=UPI00031EA48A|nr:amidohydrolase family protein [Arthrobacter sp. M2012083]